jgi:phenylpropionate dioxygenase-like ring-hydroxylating dioxygenase large terminal subunit
MRGSIFDDNFFHDLQRSVGDVNDAEALPPACYSDPSFYTFEKEAIFNHEWLCVGHASWVKGPGDYFTTSHIGEPIIVAKGRDGIIRAMSAVCQHRAMLVAEGSGTKHAFLCPYHHWTYGLDGWLMGAPAMERARNFDKSCVRLPQIRLENWLGFLFINFDDAAPALAPRLAALEQALAPYDLSATEQPPRSELGAFPYLQSHPWNWKVHFENSNDGYHANRLHHGPIHDMCPSELASFPDLPADTAGYLRYNETVGIDVGFNATRKAILPNFPGLGAEGRKRFIFANIPPTFFIFTQNDYIIYSILRCEGPELTIAERSWMVAPGAMGQPLFRERLEMIQSTSTSIVAQDRHVDALVQVGLKSRFATRGRYSWQEGAQRNLNAWLVPRYRAAWERLKQGSLHMSLLAAAQ